MDKCQLCYCELPESGPVIRVWRAISQEYLTALQEKTRSPQRDNDHPDHKPYEHRLWTVCEDCLNRPLAIYVRAATKLNDFETLFVDEESSAATSAMEELRVWLRMRLPDNGEELPCHYCRRPVIVYNADNLTVSNRIFCSDACSRGNTPPEQSCNHCGERYTPARRNRSRFCCNACKQANYRMRKSIAVR